MNTLYRQAEYEISTFLWSRVKLLDALTTSVIKGYLAIVETIEYATSDDSYEIIRELSIWLRLLDDTPKMGFNNGAHTPIYPELAKNLYTLQTEYNDINKPYEETIYFLYEKLKTLATAEPEVIKGYADLLQILSAQPQAFDEHLAPGLITDFHTWALLYQRQSSEAVAFGKKLRTRYDFFQKPYKNKDFPERRTHDATYELAFFFWSRVRMCDSSQKETITLYRELASQLLEGLRAGELENGDYLMMHHLTVALELLESFPYFGNTALATIDSYDYYQTRQRLYDMPAQYVDFNQPIFETARFLYEKLISLNPTDTSIVKSYRAPLVIFARPSNSSFERALPGFLSQLLSYAETLENGTADTATVVKIRKEFPLLFSHV